MKCFLAAPVAALILLAPPSARAVVYRVDERSTALLPDGATWSTAYPTVSAALAKAAAGDSVWVAAGTYNESVSVPTGVALMGGFTGTEVSLSVRNPVSNPTVLHGSGANATSASHSVVTLPSNATAATVVDGFTITNGGGTAVQTLMQSGACSGRGGGGWRKVYLEFRGGGVMVTGGSPTITNNVIAGNSTAHSYASGTVSCHSVAYYYQAGNGGGIYVARGATPTISGNTIRDDSAQTGGGVYCDGAAVSIVANTITANSATLSGGGISDIAPGTITGNVIANNTAGGDGGGISGGGLVQGNRFEGNHAAGNGGGIDGGGTLEDNVFASNIAAVGGGGLHASAACIVARCTFTTNTALDGGAIASEGGLAELRDSVVADNVGMHSGAAAVIGGTAVVESNTIADNSSPLGAVVLSGPGSGFAQRVLFVNNIVAGNQSGISVQGALAPIRFNDVWHNSDGDYINTPSLAGQYGNVTSDPQFIAAAAANYHIAASSPCVDAGGTVFVPSGDTDRDGAARIQGKGVDIGAFESAGAPSTAASGPIHVASSGSDTNDGSTWASSMATVQQALDVAAARGGGEIWVAKGTYPGPLTAFAPVQLYGGFAGTEANRADRNWSANVTTLDGHGLGTVVSADSAVPGAFSLFTLDGFDVRNGSDAANAGGVMCGQVSVAIANDIVESNIGAQGAGINVLAARGSVSASTIRNNQAPPAFAVAHTGGGVLANAAVTVAHCTVSGNTSDLGGGVYGAGSVTDSVVSGNAANQNGGGLYNCSSVIRNVIRDNVAGYEGGGVMYGVALEDNLIENNLAGAYGGGADVISGESVLNNTIVNNLCPAGPTPADDGQGAGINVAYAFGGTAPAVVTNNIVALNSSGISLTNPNATFLENDVFGNPGYDWSTLSAPAGNLAVDPLFVNQQAQDYHLQAGSPCIDAGSDAAAALGDTDLNGNPRRIGAHVDIGAYEFAAAGAYTLADASRALGIAGGLISASASDEARLGFNAGRVAGDEAVRIARKATGLDANP